jgi:putative PIN family toxin of toxin-antitoxin system
MRIVLDTAILVRANAQATGPARLLLERIAVGRHQLILSPFLLDETERVLHYPRVQALYGLSPSEIRRHIDLLIAVAEIVDPVVTEPIVLKDPNDDPVVYAAVTGRADALCTLDRDFFEPAVVEFCRMRNIRVMTDVRLLALLSAEAPTK